MAIWLIISVYYIEKNIEKVCCNSVSGTLLFDFFGFITHIVGIFSFFGDNNFFL